MEELLKRRELLKEQIRKSQKEIEEFGILTYTSDVEFNNMFTQLSIMDEAIIDDLLETIRRLEDK